MTLNEFFSRNSSYNPKRIKNSFFCEDKIFVHSTFFFNERDSLKILNILAKLSLSSFESDFNDNSKILFRPSSLFS